MSFTGVIGHDRIKTVLSRMLDQGTLPHAFLFLGADGVGKTTVIQALARNLLNHSGDLYAHSDYLQLNRLIDEKTGKRKSQISVTQVRELTSRLGLSSLSGGWKVVFIEEADRLSAGAANALLKTLEEPKGNVLFFLRATDAQQLPATIVSRCQVLRFGSVAREQMQAGLVKLGFSKTDAVPAVALALGRPGRALRFLKDSSYRSELETGMTQALRFFSVSLPERLAQVMELIPKSELQKDEALDSTLDAWELLSRDLLLHKLGEHDWQVLPRTEEMKALADRISAHTLLELFSRLKQVRTASASHVNSHLALEHIALAI